MENDLPNERQASRIARNGSISSHSQADGVFVKGLPLMARHQSLENLPRPGRYTSAVVELSVDQLDTQLKDMELSRVHESQINAELDASKQHWQQLRKAYRKSRIQYENAIDPFGTQADAVSANQVIAELREVFINDRSILESYAADVRKIKRRLRTAQLSRGRCELAFMQSARQWERAPISNSLVDTTAPLTSAQTRPHIILPSVASPSEMEFLLERYQSKVAAVNILGERLADYNYEYWNEVARRELLRDHEEALSVGDDEFEETSKREKDGITQELSKAIEEADQLKADCVSAGADIHNLEQQSLRFTHPVSLTDFGYGNSLQAALDKVPTQAFVNVENVRGDLSEDESAHSEHGKTSRLVKSWMDDVPLGQDAESSFELLSVT